MSKSILEIKAELAREHKPFPAYSFPKLTRDGVLTTLEPTKYDIHTGKRVPIPVRVVKNGRLVVSYRFVKAIWSRILHSRPVRPPQTLLPHSTLLKPGTSPHKASKGRREFDPYGDFAFHVEIGPMRMAFSKFDGVDVEIDQIEYKDSLDTHPRNRPGIRRVGKIKLTKGCHIAASSSGTGATRPWKATTSATTARSTCSRTRTTRTRPWSPTSSPTWS